MIPRMFPERFNIDWKPEGRGLPTPHRELRRSEFLRLHCMDHYSLEGVAWRDVAGLHPQGHMVDLQIYHHFRYSLGVAQMTLHESPWSSKPDDSGWDLIHDRETFNGHNYYYLRYFVFGCEHANMQEVGAEKARELGIQHWGMHCHVWWCSNCGFRYAVDSSG